MISPHKQPKRGLAVAAFSAAILASAVGCGGGGGAPGPSADGGGIVAGSNSVTGSLGFSVGDAFFGATWGPRDCGYQGVLADGSYATLVVILTEQANTCVSPDASGSISGHVLWLQVASATYATTGASTPDAGAAPIALGVHTIDYEGVPDEDLCMLSRSGASAILEVFDTTGGVTSAVGIAASGTVTLAALTSSRIAGSFNVMIAPVGPSSIDTLHQVPLAGRFDSAPCSKI
jgi:hypothetical protein